MQAHTMILSLEEIENFLIDKKLIRRDEIEELKEQKHFGRSNCKALGRFIKAVREDYKQIFPKKPCAKSFRRTAEKLFREGGSREFPASETQPISALVSEIQVLKKRPKRDCITIVDYNEEEEIEKTPPPQEEIEKTPPLQAREFFVKSSQERKGEGKGSNNPKLSLATKHFLFSQMAAGTSLPDMLKINKDYHHYFAEFQDSASSASPSRSTLYRIKGNLPLASKFQRRDFVRSAERLTLATDGKERKKLGDNSNTFPFKTDVGSRMATARTNSESLMIHLDPVIASLKKHEESNEKAKALLLLFRNRGELLLELSLVVLVWSAFCGPILRTTEKKDSTVEDVRIALRNGAKDAEKVINADGSYSTLAALATDKSNNQKYYSKLKALMGQPRTKSFENRLNDSAVKGVKALQVKLLKDLQQYEKVSATGKYVCSNRFAESVFGQFKKLEEGSTVASLEKISEETITRMNKTESYLRNMPETQVKELWKEIDGRTELLNYKNSKAKMTIAVEEFAKSQKEKLAEEKAQKEKRREVRKRRNEENEKYTPTRRKLPLKKRMIKTANSDN